MNKKVKIRLNDECITLPLPESYEQLKRSIENHFALDTYNLQYQDGDQHIELQDQDDYKIAKQIQTNVMQIQIKSPNSKSLLRINSAQSIPRRKSSLSCYPFYEGLIENEQLECCKDIKCKICKGQNIVQFTPQQKIQFERMAQKGLQDRFVKLKQFYQTNLGIQLNTEDDFLFQHQRLMKSNRLPIVQNNRSSISSIGHQINPQFNKNASIIRSSQDNLKQSQLLNPVSHLIKQKLQAQFIDLKIAPVFEPNQNASFIVTIINTGNEWPKMVKLKLTGNEYQTSTNLPALRPQEVKIVKIVFMTPKIPNKYTFEWRLCTIENQVEELFGARLITEFRVGYSVETKRNSFISKILNVFSLGNKLSITQFVDEQLEKYPNLNEEQLINNYLDNNNKEGTNIL